MGKQVSSRDAIREIEARGWVLARSRGDHFTYKNPTNPMLITLPHPVKSLSPGIVRDVERKAGIRF
jgi:predicted RNA binding protein YcfA (HicA-like mRNA interferase family)